MLIWDNNFDYLEEDNYQVQTAYKQGQYDQK